VEPSSSVVVSNVFADHDIINGQSRHETHGQGRGHPGPEDPVRQLGFHNPGLHRCNAEPFRQDDGRRAFQTSNAERSNGKIPNAIDYTTPEPSDTV
jgi:hypothetical protein